MAGYTAFLFAQCEGRDLWQSKWLLPHLLFQALLCGAAVLLPFTDEPTKLVGLVLAGAIGHFVLSTWETVRSHHTGNARQAAAFLPVVAVGPLRGYRDGLIIGVGVAVLLALVAPAAVFAPVLAGLVLYEYAFVRAGQLPPLS